MVSPSDQSASDPTLSAVVVERPRRARIIKAGAVVALSTLASLLLLEFALRAALFGGGQAFSSLRRAGRYADSDNEEDYWKLEYKLGARFPPPEHPHPVLGWIGRFSRDTYLHEDTPRLNGRRPVLLYGDSFAMCAEGVECFEDVLNSDPAFAAEHFLLNYGVGGYGVDQIMLLLQRSIDLYDRPFVVLGLMTLDLDRSILSVRTGQKPRFKLEHGELVLDSPPIQPDAAAFFDRHPPEIFSYVYRGLLYSRLVPKSITAWLVGEEELIARKKAINEQLLLTMLNEVRSRGLDFAFLVFHPSQEFGSYSSDWQDPFLRELLEREQVPCIWARNLIEPTVDGKVDYNRYYIPGDGHPTTLFNTVVSGRIREAVFSSN